MKLTIKLLVIFLFLFSCQDEGQIPGNSDNGVQPPPSQIQPKPPVENPAKGILKIGVLGDLNGALGDPNYDTSVKKGMGHILNTPFDLILGTGDFTSGEDYKKKFPASRFREMWSSFEAKILNPILNKGIPFAPTAGNHDANIERERGYYKDFWNGKKPAVTMVSSEMWPFYYSFTFKGVFFVSLDDVRTYSLRDRTHNGVTQREWLINQLASPEARESVARIVFGHVPIYPVLSKSKHSSGSGRGKYYEILDNEQQGKRNNSLESIMKEGEVTLAIFGHSHAYYPGFVQHKSEALESGLRVLQMPCLGQGNRYLDQRTKARSSRGFGIVEINLEDGSVDFDSADYNGNVIPKGTLPAKISPYSTVDIHRYDLVKGRLQGK